MSTNKSVSPAEFRLHNKVFKVDFSPSNYYEKLRFEMIIQKLIFWFWRHYGIYFYIQKLKVLDEKVLLQVYFYKTYLYSRFVRKGIRLKNSRGASGGVNFTKGKNKKTFEWLQFYNPELFAALVKVKSLTRGFVKARRQQRRRYGPRLLGKYYRRQQNAVVRTSVINTSFNHFFTYFFLHFFKSQSVILAKSLYKVVTANPHFKVEHQTLLYRTRYLRRYRWSFDFLFLFNYALTFSNTNFVLPFFITHVVRKYKQLKYAKVFFNVLRKLYFLKRNIRAIKVLVNGPYNRHGRTHFSVLKIGELALSQSQSCVVYDAIQWLTPYGAISLKL